MIREDKINYGVIIGATGYLGSDLADYFSKKNINLILIGRNKKKLDTLNKKLFKKYKIKHKVIVENFNLKSLNNFEKKINKYSMYVNFIFITIGEQKPIGNFNNLSFIEWQENINVNLFKTTYFVQFFIKCFLRFKTKGSVVLFSGGGGTTPRPGFSAYAVAKAGLIRFVETIALELLDSDIKINIVAPGIMPSKMLRQIIKNKKIVNSDEFNKSSKALLDSNSSIKDTLELCDYLISNDCDISGKIISSNWDNWRNWKNHLDELNNSDLYTLRRITGKDRKISWGDKN